jgi:hypothetical protein
MKIQYKNEVRNGLLRTNSLIPALIAEIDLDHLPPIVKKYLIQSGVVGTEQLFNMRIKFEGRLRSKPQDSWMNFSSEQYNFFDHPARIFFIKAYKMGIPAMGIHQYRDGKASMVIKLLGLFKIVDARGAEMDQGETVTVFNDMCCMAPATLIDRSIQWEIIDPVTVKAKFTNGKITISSSLIFNESGELLNFISNDRFETADGKTYNNYPWSTPVRETKVIKGIRVCSAASTIYHRPDNDFCYGEFILKEIEYNCKEFR